MKGDKNLEENFLTNQEDMDGPLINPRKAGEMSFPSERNVQFHFSPNVIQALAKQLADEVIAQGALQAADPPPVPDAETSKEVSK